MTSEEGIKLADQLMRGIASQFTCVLLLTTWEDEDGATHYAFRSTGNSFAKRGMAAHWLAEAEAMVVAKEIASELNPPDEDWKI